MTPQNGQLPPAIPSDWGYAFYYGSLSWLTVYYRVPLSVLEPHLNNTGFVPAVFADGDGAVGLNPMTYGSHLENLVEATTEAELNVLAYPADRASAVPVVAFTDFLLGMEQTKIIGNYRLWVPCDDPIAVEAGRAMFGENKFTTTLPYSFPGPNSPATAWTFLCCDPNSPSTPQHGCDPGKGCDPANPNLFIFRLTANLQGAVPVLGSNSPILDYSVRMAEPDEPPLRPIGSVRNLLGPLQTYLAAPGGALEDVVVTTGSSTHPMTEAVRELVAGRPCVAAQIFQSASPVIESRPFWADQG
jgi:hypothetical protein